MRNFLLVTAFLALASGTAEAANFCVVGMGIPPQCFYNDVRSCMNAAQPPNSFCAVNPDARLYYYGSSDFCAVHSVGIAQCIYGSLEECYSDSYRGSFRDRVVCMDRAQHPDNISPYRYDQRIDH